MDVIVHLMLQPIHDLHSVQGIHLTLNGKLIGSAEKRYKIALTVHLEIERIARSNFEAAREIQLPMNLLVHFGVQLIM